LSSPGDEAVVAFLRELCDSAAVKRPVTLLARRYQSVTGRRGRRFRGVDALHLAGNTHHGLVSAEDENFPRLDAIRK